MSDMSISEAKQITGKLEQLLLKLSGTKNEDGTTNKIGLIEELEILQTKLNPNSVKYIGNLEREKTLESLKQIEELFDKQRENMEELSLYLKSSLEDVGKGYLQDMRKLGENTLYEWLEPSIQELEEKYKNLQDKIDFLGRKKDHSFWVFLLAFGGALCGGVVVGALL